MSPILDMPVPAYCVTRTHAATDVAAKLEERILEIARKLGSANVVNHNRREALRRLNAAVNEADPRTPEGLRTAAAARYVGRFLKILPEEVTPPDIDVAEEGQVLLEWIVGRGNRLVIAFSEIGELDFAALHPAGELKGREYFTDKIAPPLSLALSRALG